MSCRTRYDIEKLIGDLYELDTPIRDDVISAINFLYDEIKKLKEERVKYPIMQVSGTVKMTDYNQLYFNLEDNSFYRLENGQPIKLGGI